MGLLDDAIREHLELKRRRGGDPAEIARAEQEALGPVRREPEPAAPTADAPHDERVQAELHDEGHGHDGAPAVHAEELAAAHDFDDEPSRPPAPPEEQTRILTPEERHRDEASHRHVPEQHVAAPADRLSPGEESFEEHREPAVPEQHLAAPADKLPEHHDDPHADRRRSEVVDQPTTEYRVEDHHHDDAPPSSDEDVLEETPDFLQETPEHDRLWFEQRPPRDFDFDD